MTTTENRPGAVSVGPAQEAHNGSGATSNVTPVGYSSAQGEYLQRGWRVTMPNLEQTGLLTVDYRDLTDLAADSDSWEGTYLLDQVGAVQDEVTLRALRGGGDRHRPFAKRRLDGLLGQLGPLHVGVDASRHDLRPP